VPLAVPVLYARVVDMRYAVRPALSQTLQSHQLCPDIIFAATPPYDGTLARYYRVPGHLAYRLPNSVSLEEGALVRSLMLGISLNRV